MFLNSERYTVASQEFFASRTAAFMALTSTAVQGAEKIVALNLAVAKASADNSAALAKNLLSAKDPQTVFSLVTASAMPNADRVAAYSRDLAEIVFATKAELSKVAGAHVAETQSRVSAWVDGVTQNAPAGTEAAGAMLKSVIATAKAGYEHINGAATQAVEAAEAQITKASEQLTQGAKKAAAR